MELTALVTGSTDGIGKATALELARRGWRVILHGRSAARIAQASAEIAREVPGAQLEAVIADLASLTEVRAMGAALLSRFDRLDVLLHNAGVFAKQRTLSADGFELTLAVNHLAPFVLTRSLLPLLRASRARVITVSSVAHSRARIDFEDLQSERRFDGYRVYAQSKLANILFANELAERESGNLTSNSLHPGVIGTKLLQTGFGIGGASAEEGAATSVYLATSLEVTGLTGKYFSDCREISPAPAALDRAVQKRLWETTAALIGEMA